MPFRSSVPSIAPGYKTARWAGDFVKSLGVVVHSDPNNSDNVGPYLDTAGCVAVLSDIGITTVRDGFTPNTSQRDLNATRLQQIQTVADLSIILTDTATIANFKAAVQAYNLKPCALENLNEPWGFDAGGSRDFGNFRGAWQNATAYVANDVVSVGGWGYTCLINHTSNANGPDGTQTFVSPRWKNSWATDCVSLAPLISALRDQLGWGATSKLLSPSMYADATRDFLGAVPNSDVSNYHDYSVPGNAGDGASFLGSFLGIPDLLSQGQIKWVTEFGYQSATTVTAYTDSSKTYLNETDHATYMLRAWAYAFLHQCERFVIYELCDKPLKTTDGNEWGIVHTDLTYKAAATQIKIMAGLLAESSPTYYPAPLGFTLATSGPTIDVLPLRRADGSYFLLLWQEGAIVVTAPAGGGSPYASGSHVDAATATATIAFPKPVTSTALYQPSLGSAVQSSTGAVSSVAVPMRGDLVLLKVVP